jgi:hypothetical protein
MSLIKLKELSMRQSSKHERPLARVLPLDPVDLDNKVPNVPDVQKRAEEAVFVHSRRALAGPNGGLLGADFQLENAQTLHFLEDIDNATPRLKGFVGIEHGAMKIAKAEGSDSSQSLRRYRTCQIHQSVAAIDVESVGRIHEQHGLGISDGVRQHTAVRGRT